MHISIMLFFWSCSLILLFGIVWCWRSISYFRFLASLPYMSIGTGVVVAVTLQQVDGSPDAETSTQCDNESLKNGYCAIEKCHKCVPPCTMRPCRRMNSDFPFACAPANGQTYSQVSNPNQKPGYVKRRQLAAPSYSVVSSAPMTSSSPEQTYLA